MPGLEHFRKQAKLYLRWHRSRYYFGKLTDREVIECSFRLSDAQQLVARKSGFESWQALKKGLEAVTDEPVDAASRSRLLASEPQLFVLDIEKSCEFYVRKLGFAVVFTYGAPPFYAQVARDGARLNLRHVDRAVIDGKARIDEDLLSTMIVIDHAKPLFLEYPAAGVDFHQTLRTEPWGARTFIVKDPNGNLIGFAADSN